MTNSVPTNLKEALNSYLNSLPNPAQSQRFYSNLKTIFKLMFLPQMNLTPDSPKNWEKSLAHLSIKLFAVEAKRVYLEAEELARQAGKTHGTLKNYRSHFFRFFKWIESQDWYQEVVQPTDFPKYIPPLRAGVTLAQVHKGRKQAGAHPYGLKDSELTPHLTTQLESLHLFLTNEWLREQAGDRPINQRTWKGYKNAIMWFLGWLKNEMSFDLSYLDLTLMVDLDTLSEYISWQFSVKGNGYRYAMQTGIAALNIAKWNYKPQSKLVGYTHCPQVLELRQMIRRISARTKTDRRTTSAASLAEKLLELEQCLEVVQYLRDGCAERFRCGRKRPTHAIIDSLQDYLIVAILTFTPVRQQEIRELQIGKNLRRELDGWWVQLTPEDHKTGRKTGKGREYPLFPCHLKEQLTKHLDLYVHQWRPLANLKHDYLFFRPGSRVNPATRGEPITEPGYLSTMIPKLIFRITTLMYGQENAKSPSPHDFRRICATWVCKYGTPEEVAIYAEIMGHSPEVMLATYQQCSSRDKTERAETAFRRVREREVQIKAEKSQKTIPEPMATPVIPPAVLAILTPQQKQRLIDQGLL